jgi:hypothetical protein
MKPRWALFPDGLGAFCMKSITDTFNHWGGSRVLLEHDPRQRWCYVRQRTV